MSIKEFAYRGKNLEEIKKLSLKEFAELLPARQKRCLIRGLSEEKQKFLEKLKKSSKRGKTIEQGKNILANVIEKKAAIPFKRYNRDMGHKTGMAAGRYPKKASSHI